MNANSIKQEATSPAIIPTDSTPDHQRIASSQNSVKNSVIIISVLVVSIFSGVGGYILGKKNTIHTNATLVTQSPAIKSTALLPSPTFSITPTVIVSNGWILYTNSYFNYSMMRPLDWIVSENANHDITFYPPGAESFANTPQNSPGSGIEPMIRSNIIAKPFVKPGSNGFMISKLEIIQLSSGIEGYYYTIPGAPISVVNFDVPYNNGTNTLEFSLISVGKENIDSFNMQHHTLVKDADNQTFKAMMQSLTFL